MTVTLVPRRRGDLKSPPRDHPIVRPHGFGRKAADPRPAWPTAGPPPRSIQNVISLPNSGSLGSWMAGPPYRSVGPAPNSTHCGTTSAVTMSGPSTGGPPRGGLQWWYGRGARSATGAWSSCLTLHAQQPPESRMNRGSTPELRRRCCSRCWPSAEATAWTSSLTIGEFAHALNRPQKAICWVNSSKPWPPLEAELIELDWQQVPAQVRAVSAHRSMVVLLTALDGGAPPKRGGSSPTVAQLSRQHVVVVASVRDPLLSAMKEERTTASQVFRAAAAERALLERSAVTAQLRQLGAEVVDAEPHDVPPLLADTYIRLKAAGRL